MLQIYEKKYYIRTRKLRLYRSGQGRLKQYKQFRRKTIPLRVNTCLQKDEVISLWTSEPVQSSGFPVAVICYSAGHTLLPVP